MNELVNILRDASLGSPWLAAGLDAAVKAALMIAGAGLVVLTLRRASAAARHLAWGLGLVAALAVLPLALLLPRWSLPILPASGPATTPGPASGLASAPTVALAPVDDRRDESPVSPTVPALLARPGPEVRPTRSVTAIPLADRALWVLVLWVAGALVVVAPVGIATARVHRLARRCERLEGVDWAALAREIGTRLGLGRPVRLLKGGHGTMPMTWGILRPFVLLPSEAERWSEERRRIVLLHELAHVRRRDCLTQHLGQAACAIYWFNPLAWWAAHRLRVERERACDDLVLAAGERSSTYAGHLLELARSLRAPGIVSGAAVAMARPSQLEGRLLAILDTRQPRYGLSRWVVMLGLTATLGVAVLLAGVSLQRRASAAALDREVRGIVVRPDGEPLPAASVVLLAPQPAASRWEGRRGVVLGRATSDASGHFHININNDKIEPNDGFLIIATASGFSFMSRRLSDLNGPVDEPIRLAPEQPVDVRLVDLEGAPIAGAEVHLRYAFCPSGNEGLGSESLTNDALPALADGWTADADGRFRLRGLGPGESLGLGIRASGFGHQLVRVETKADVRTATLALGRAHVIEGRVTLGEGGPPAEGARVQAQSMSSKDGMGVGLGDAEATVAADGRYRLEAAPGNSIRVEVYPPREGADAYLLRGKIVNPGDAVVSRTDFVLPRGVLVRGRVTDAASGRPIAGAVVTHQAQRRNNPYYIRDTAAWFNGDEQKAITADDGSFQLGVMPGPGYLLVKGPTPDYLHQEISGVDLHGQLLWPNRRYYPDALQKVNPKPEDGTVEGVLTLRRGTTVRGRLVGPDGAPVRDAMLFSRWYLGASRSGQDMTIDFGEHLLPASGGRFALHGCDPDSSAPVFFLDAKRQQGAVVELSGKQAGQDLEVRLERCGSATVRLVDDQGKPLRAGRTAAHLEIVLTPGASFAEIFTRMAKQDKQSPLMADAMHVGNLDRERYAGLTTDAEGRMVFPTLIPGATYRVIVHNQPVKTQIDFTVQPGEARDLGDLMIPNVNRAG
jgi:beta-lactamase regulating signal transducer with metallopeptidase domain